MRSLMRLMLMLPVGLGYLVLWGQAPYVATTFPQADSKGIACYSTIRATLQFPSEARQLDPITLNERSVHLFPADAPEKHVEADLDYDVKQQVLILVPKGPMSPHTQYTFEITRGLIDSRGFAFLPFRLQFETDDCDHREAPAVIKPTAPTQTSLSDWGVKAKGDSLLLGWQTLTEYQCLGFILERAEGDSLYQAVAWLDAAGSSTVPLSYQWIDTTASVGLLHYRLKLISASEEPVFLDSLQTYREGIDLAFSLLRIGQPLQLEFHSRERSSIVLLMRDRDGQVVKRKAGFVAKGAFRQLVDLSDLSVGDYSLQVSTPRIQLGTFVRIRPDRTD